MVIIKEKELALEEGEEQIQKRQKKREGTVLSQGLRDSDTE